MSDGQQYGLYDLFLGSFESADIVPADFDQILGFGLLAQLTEGLDDG